MQDTAADTALFLSSPAHCETPRSDQPGLGSGYNQPQPVIFRENALQRSDHLHLTPPQTEGGGELLSPNFVRLYE